MAAKTKKVSIGQRLLEEGWFQDTKEAKAWIMARQVLAGDELIHSLSDKVSLDAAIRVKEYYKKKYVNKGGLKLEGALRDFNLDIKGKIALDCGASTGGFTDCLLHAGASMVYAVDAGFGQLEGKLQNDNRVVNLEKTNLEDEKLRSLLPKPEIISLDLSYLSLKKALPICKNILGEYGQVVSLVKPIYEVESCDIRRSGDINQYDILKDILVDLCQYFTKNNVHVLGVTNSQVTGNKGTLEYFFHIGWMENDMICDIATQIEYAVERSFQLEKFDKNTYGI